MPSDETQGQLVRVDTGAISLERNLDLPARAHGVVLFAHGSGSSRHSPRNRYVAQVLQQAGFATLLIDLLTAAEEAIDRHTGHLRFDIALLAMRLLGATDWLYDHPSTRHLRIGYFGASTGSAAALCAAAERPNLVSAIVSLRRETGLSGPQPGSGAGAYPSDCRRRGRPGDRDESRGDDTTVD